MRPALWFLLLFALAVAITLLARFDAGYVVIVLPPWRLEMSFMLAAVATFLLFSLVLFVARVIRLALRLPADVQIWRRRRRSDKAEDEMSRAIAAYLAGRTGLARELATKANRRAPLPMATLVAAHAALAEGDKESAGQLLQGFNSDVAELTMAREAVEAKLGEQNPPLPEKPSAKR